MCYFTWQEVHVVKNFAQCLGFHFGPYSRPLTQSFFSYSDGTLFFLKFFLSTQEKSTGKDLSLSLCLFSSESINFSALKCGFLLAHQFFHYMRVTVLTLLQNFELALIVTVQCRKIPYCKMLDHLGVCDQPIRFKDLGFPDCGDAP